MKWPTADSFHPKMPGAARSLDSLLCAADEGEFIRRLDRLREYGWNVKYIGANGRPAHYLISDSDGYAHTIYASQMRSTDELISSAKIYDSVMLKNALEFWALLRRGAAAHHYSYPEENGAYRHELTVHTGPLAEQKKLNFVLFTPHRWLDWPLAEEKTPVAEAMHETREAHGTDAESALFHLYAAAQGIRPIEPTRPSLSV